MSKHTGFGAVHSPKCPPRSTHPEHLRRTQQLRLPRAAYHASRSSAIGQLYNPLRNNPAGFAPSGTSQAVDVRQNPAERERRLAPMVIADGACVRTPMMSILSAARSGPAASVGVSGMATDRPAPTRRRQHRTMPVRLPCSSGRCRRCAPARRSPGCLQSSGGSSRRTAGGDHPPMMLARRSPPARCPKHQPAAPGTAASRQPPNTPWAAANLPFREPRLAPAAIRPIWCALSAELRISSACRRDD